MQAVRDGATRYTAVTGEAALRKAICDDLERRKGVKYAPEEIIVGNGAKQEVYQAVLALCRCVFCNVMYLALPSNNLGVWCFGLLGGRLRNPQQQQTSI